MAASRLTLIRKLKERNADRPRARGSNMYPPKLVPRVAPATAKDLQAAERTLRFRLPELLRAVYLEVGNGGFGQAYGIVGTKRGFKYDKHSLESCYQEMFQLHQENPVWRWPKRLLPLANYGCGMWSCVDCDLKKLPMILWDPNGLDSEHEGSDARLNWGNSFWHQGQTLKSWLEGWLADKEEPEPKWPSAGWMRKRLGFTMPK